MVIEDGQGITSGAELESLVLEVKDCPVLCLDTEFMCGHTYQSKLALIQLAYGEKAVWIDVLGIKDLSPLKEVLMQKSCIKVIHSAQGDCFALMGRLGVVPSPIFDTQIAAGICGLIPQIGYATLAYELLGVKVDKQGTLSDWFVRPLSPAMIEYALNDVRYLSSLYEKLRKSLEVKGRLSWLDQECWERFQPYASSAVIDDKVRRFRYKGYPEQTCRFYRKLLLWRLDQALLDDIPLSRILRDKQIKFILRAGNPAECFQDLTEHDAKTAGLAEYTSPLPMPKKSGKRHQSFGALYEKAHNLLQERALKQEISLSLMAPQRLIDEMLCDENEPRLFQGWRRQSIGDQALDALKNLRLKAKSSDLVVSCQV